MHFYFCKSLWGERDVKRDLLRRYIFCSDIFSIPGENIPPENILASSPSYNLFIVTEAQKKLRTGKKNIIGDRLREARLSRTPKVTQIDLSALLSAYGLVLTQAAISKIESGDRPVFDYELKAIGEALVVDVSWLIKEDKL